MAHLFLSQTVPIRHPAYATRLRASDELWLNDGATGLCKIDLKDGQLSPLIPWPEELEDFLIQDWLISPRGDLSYFFSSDGLRYCLELNHELRRWRKIEIPPPPFFPSGLACFEDRLSFVDLDGNVWRLEDSRMEPVSWSDQTAKRLRAIADELKPFGVSRTLYSNDAPAWLVRTADQVGYARDLHAPPKTVDDVSGVRGFVWFEDSLFLLFKHQLSEVKDGKPFVLVDATEEEEFHGFEAVQWQGRPALAVLHSRTQASEPDVQFYMIEKSKPI